MSKAQPPKMIPVEEQIPGLRRRAAEMIEISKQLVTGAFVAGGDAFGHMALTFLNKQAVHMVSILNLGDSPDTKLIARSMVEGVGQLLWAGIGAPSTNPTRAELWQHFSAVTNWRAVQQALAEGAQVPQETQQEVQADINQYGPWYPHPRGRKDDTYRNTWHGTTIRQMFIEIDARNVRNGLVRAGDPGAGDTTYYQGLYAPYSSWSHWSVEGITPLLNIDDTSVTFDARSPYETAKALRVGFSCLRVTAAAVDEHLSRGQTAKLDEISREYASWLTSGAVT